MPDYRRVRIPGATYFFTLVVNRRERLFACAAARRCLAQSLLWLREGHPFQLDAAVLLPDHIHMMLTLPAGDTDYPTRLMLLKKRFTLLARTEPKVREGWVTNRARIRGEAGFWQRRYWEHTIRDAPDFKRHLEYIFFNPVKHRLVDRVKDWPYSSFHRYVKSGTYTTGWCGDISKAVENLRAGE